METLSLRMHRSAQNAARVAQYLTGHPKIAQVNYLGFLAAGDPSKAVFDRQCEGAGSTFGCSATGAACDSGIDIGDSQQRSCPVMTEY